MDGYYIVRPETYVAASILIAILPVIVLLTYYMHKDHGGKEPFFLMRKIFLWGLLVIAPVILIEVGLREMYFSISDSKLIFAFVSPFIFVALPEELAKFLVVKKIAYNHTKFDEIMDGITYTILASMGFAVFENLLYTYQYGLDIALIRSITAVPAHALFSGIMGYYIGYAKFIKDKNTRVRTFAKGIVAGVFFHGLYDFLLGYGLPELILMIFPLLAYMWYVLEKAIKFAQGYSPKPLQYL